MEELKYPIGKFQYLGPYSEAQREELIEQIASLPEQLKVALNGLTKEQLGTPYRPDGWTIRQVVHHMADSHMNGYIRFKWSLTEETPTIKAYNQENWANLHDSLNTPVEVSVNLLEALHRRWVALLKSLSPEDFKKTFNHPESGITSLDRILGLYAWHGRHHLKHVMRNSEQ